MIKDAVEYAKRGWRIFPLCDNGKLPRGGSHGFNDATDDIEQINRWWSEYPDANIGVATGIKNGLFCLDIDKKEGKNGFIWLEAQPQLPVTVAQTTPSGGEQYIFRMPEEDFKSESDELALGVDIRANEGYFVAPPSYIKKRHNYPYSGKYEWLVGQSPNECELADVPEWLLEQLRAKRHIDTENDHSEHENILPISDVIQFYKIKLSKNPHKPGVCSGAHPKHSSTNGKNFHIDTQKNQWCCFRHRKPDGNPTGGGSLHLVAVMEGILECGECMPKALNGDRFKKVLKAVEDNFGISADQFQQGDIDKIKSSVLKIDAKKPKDAIIEELKTLAKDISKLNEVDYLTICSFIKERLRLNQSEIKIIRLTVADKKRKKSKNIIIDTDDSGRPVATDRNALSIIENDPNLSGTFKKDLFSRKIMVYKGGGWCSSNNNFPRQFDDDDISQVKRYFIDKYGLQYKYNSVNEAVISIAVKNSFDALEEYLNGLEWDGVPRIDKWFVKSCDIKNTSYHRWIGKLMLVAAVKRALNPGIKFDHVIVLAGNQGVMKSTLLEKLAGDEWFICSKLDDRDRDVIHAMQGKWFVELAEGVPLKKKDIEELKSFITARQDTARFAWERHQKDYKRRSILIMSINPSVMGYLADATGNRRFLPVRIDNKIDIKYVEENRDQLFAEAIIAAKSGFNIYLDESIQKDQNIIKALKTEIDTAETKDDWEDAIIEWLLSGRRMAIDKYGNEKPVDVPVPEVGNCMDVWCYAFGGERAQYDPGKQGRRIGAIFTRLGFSSKSIRDGEDIKRGFRLKEIADTFKKKESESASKQARDALKEENPIPTPNAKDDVDWDE